jgi:hypothetical protein
MIIKEGLRAWAGERVCVTVWAEDNIGGKEYGRK